MVKITEAEYNATNPSRLLTGEIYTGTDSLSLTNATSGGSIPTTYLSLIDKYGQNVGSDSSSISTLNINTTGASTTYTPVLSGTTTILASKGMFKFDGVTFTSEPGSTYNLYFSSTGIDITKPTNIAFLATSSSSTAQLDLTVSLRYCIIGEAFLITGACLECTAGTQYSLTTMTTPGD